MQYTIFINFDKLKFIHGYEAWENWEKKSSWGSEMNNMNYYSVMNNTHKEMCNIWKSKAPLHLYII